MTTQLHSAAPCADSPCSHPAHADLEICYLLTSLTPLAFRSLGQAASTQGVHEWVEADQLQRARLTATMSDWLTGEEYPNAIIFSARKLLLIPATNLLASSLRLPLRPLVPSLVAAPRTSIPSCVLRIHHSPHFLTPSAYLRLIPPPLHPSFHLPYIRSSICASVQPCSIHPSLSLRQSLLPPSLASVSGVLAIMSVLPQIRMVTWWMANR